MVNDVLALANAGRWDQLESRGRAVASQHPSHVLGWKALAAALMQLGRWAEAMDATARVAKLAPTDASAHSDLGVVHYNLGQHEQAEAGYRRAIRLDPRHAGAHSNLAALLSQLGRHDEALPHAAQSLALAPNRAESHNNLATVLRDIGRYREAAAAFRRAIELQPNYFEAHLNLGMTAFDLAELDEALASYRRALALRPDACIALLRLGSLLDRLGGSGAEALACLERCAVLEPVNPEVWVALGNCHMRLKNTDASRAMFERAQALRPLIDRLARRRPADFSVVMLDTPGAGCTPIDYLTGNATYDRHLYCVLPRSSEHVDLLRAKGQVVINMVADADNGADILPFVLELVERLDRPTVNHPRLVMASSRDAVARRLAGMPLCRVPKTVRYARSVLTDAETNGVLADLSPPLLVRTAGTHGGDEFEKLDDVAAVAAFVAARPDGDYYVTEYVDYRSPDGLFRKYRFICIAGQLFPYHLAIHDDWMVHHFRTDMARQAWMRAEEESFLEDPGRVFDAAHRDAVLAMAKASGLDYCGLDVSLDAAGDVVLFETNAAMLVHDEKGETFAYKNRYIARIKDAFDAMLARLATATATATPTATATATARAAN